MSKINDACRELSIDELDAVSGGTIPGVICIPITTEGVGGTIQVCIPIGGGSGSGGGLVHEPIHAK
jgi:hypothetical protein